MTSLVEQLKPGWRKLLPPTRLWQVPTMPSSGGKPPRGEELKRDVCITGREHTIDFLASSYHAMLLRREACQYDSLQLGRA
eukprot:1159723-Pelagomonas_calceolata.AAC.1